MDTDYAEKYRLFCEHSDEKEHFQQYVLESPGTSGLRYMLEEGGNILDIGSGEGTITEFLSKTFPKTQIDAIDPNLAQITRAQTENAGTNIEYQNLSFEDFESERKYEFILQSHVLQWFRGILKDSVKKAASLLSEKGEMWFVHQSDKAFRQLIDPLRDHLKNEYFENLMQFEEYAAKIKKILGGKYKYGEAYLDTSSEGVDFVNPSEEDKKRLEFILCLDQPFDEQGDAFKADLAKLKGEVKRIRHQSGILIVRRA